MIVFIPIFIIITNAKEFNGPSVNGQVWKFDKEGVF